MLNVLFRLTEFDKCKNWARLVFGFWKFQTDFLNFPFLLFFWGEVFGIVP